VSFIQALSISIVLTHETIEQTRFPAFIAKGVESSDATAYRGLRRGSVPACLSPFRLSSRYNTGRRHSEPNLQTKATLCKLHVDLGNVSDTGEYHSLGCCVKPYTATGPELPPTPACSNNALLWKDLISSGTYELVGHNYLADNILLWFHIEVEQSSQLYQSEQYGCYAFVDNHGAVFRLTDDLEFLQLVSYEPAAAETILREGKDEGIGCWRYWGNPYDPKGQDERDTAYAEVPELTGVNICGDDEWPNDVVYVFCS